MRKRRSVLYIEDKLESRILVRRVLENHGYAMFEAGDAREGLERAGRIAPDMILLDINLPGLSGFEAAMKLRDIEVIRNVPIVALTAKALPGDRERAFISGCTGYIQKPIDIDTFPGMVARYMSGERDSLSAGEELVYLRQYTGHLIARISEAVDLSLIDELTGVGNRRFGLIRLTEEMARCRRYGTGATMMVCDIDSLRTINAKYGYDAGNHVLKVSAGLLAENRRNFDVLVRLAKDQFMFFMYGVDEPAAIRTAERIAVSVKETGYAHNGVLIPVAMSFGIKTFDLVPEELTPLRFMELADGEVARLGVRGSRHASGRLSDWTGRMEISGEKAATTA